MIPILRTNLPVFCLGVIYPDRVRYVGVVGGVVVEDVLILGGAGVITVGGAGVVVIVIILIIAVQLIAALIVRATKLSCKIIRPLTRDRSLNIFI